MRTTIVSTLVIMVCLCATAAEKPNVVLVMTDDQGWGQTGYYNHPVLKTPNLDKMAANGLRFDRFYAGAPNCSPTRATAALRMGGCAPPPQFSRNRKLLSGMSDRRAQNVAPLGDKRRGKTLGTRLG